MSKLSQKMQKMQETPFEYLVFSGGGAKGAIYSGVYEGLTDANIVAGVSAIAGSSAGAISATIIASGVTPSEFEKISKETNLQGLLGTEGVSAGPIQISKDGIPLYNLLDKTIRESINDFVKTNDFATICAERLKNIPQEQEKLEEKKQDLARQMASVDLMDDGSNELLKEIQENINGLDFQIQNLTKQSEKIKTIVESNFAELNNLKNKTLEKGNKILFKDLALLRLIEPVKFKDLFITAVRRDNGELVIFSADKTPDVEIALACRASASIPLVFKPVKIGDFEYVDGGYRDNLPVGHVQGDKSDDITELTGGVEEIQRAKKQGRVLALVFGSGENASANIAIYSGKNCDQPNAIVKFLTNVIFKMLAKVGGAFKYTETLQATEEQMRENALNTVVLDTKGIGTLSFDDAQKYAGYLHIKGKLQTLEYLDNHQVGTAVENTFEQQKFLLGVYEEYDITNLNKTFSQKILDHILPEKKKSEPITWQERDNIKNHQHKADLLLSFSTAERWKGKDEKIPPLKEYVLLAGSARNNEVSGDTKAVGALIKKLNDPTTPSKIKNDFVELLGINNAPTTVKGISEFKFTKVDFNNFLAQNKNEALRLNNEAKSTKISR